MRSDGIKSTVKSIDKHAEGTAKQQRVEDPLYWLKVPTNHLKESEMVTKRKALAREQMGEEANKPSCDPRMWT